MKTKGPILCVVATLLAYIAWRQNTLITSCLEKPESGSRTPDAPDEEVGRAEGTKVVKAEHRGLLTTELSNGLFFPQVGVGVGNLQPDSIPSILSSAYLENNKRGIPLLIDTARASNNEHIVQSALVDSEVHDDDAEVYVVTKVWYTHLGYGRTVLSVLDSLKALSASPKTQSSIKLRVTVLLHWPRCDDAIPWMHCEEEERSVEERVKWAGPSPLADKCCAWKGSWKALEDLYDAGLVSAIGVSNFNVQELNELLAMCRIVPHIYQGSAWTFLFDPNLVTTLRSNRILYQAYAVMNGVLQRGEQGLAPAAYQTMQSIANQLSSEVQGSPCSASQLLLAWLVQSDVSIIPRTSSLHHLAQNGAAAISRVPRLTSDQADAIEGAVKSLLRGQD
eukprot:157233-Prorocentrum_minimum.AAC.2